ncbi:MAG TPA: orotate phosphoribosyltransferase [Longimicrobiales bacterium]|nr:orotate phosphoribosyltransferase [Longimicrobiales bacterium]
MSERNRLLELLAERSLRRGDFVLASGKRSPSYIDARLTTMSGTGQQLIGELGWAALTEAGWKPRAIGGLTLGADPVAYAIAHVSARHGQELDAFTVRKEAKTHGTGKLIEGVFQSGWPVVIVEDVITTGESAVRALQAVRAAGASVLGVLAVVDREEGGSERLQAEGVSVRSLARVSELL